MVDLINFGAAYAYSNHQPSRKCRNSYDLCRCSASAVIACIKRMFALNSDYDKLKLWLTKFFRVMGLHQRRQAYLDRIHNVLYPRFGVNEHRSQSNVHHTTSSVNATSASRTRTGAFDKLLEAQKWVDMRTVSMCLVRIKLVFFRMTSTTCAS
jgi:hypothetical protein